MPPDRLVVVNSETQEIAWRRSQVVKLMMMMMTRYWWNNHVRWWSDDDEGESLHLFQVYVHVCRCWCKPPQSKGVRKYKFKIKKENERCLEFLVEDHDPETESIKFTIPLAFQVNEDQDGGFIWFLETFVSDHHPNVVFKGRSGVPGERLQPCRTRGDGRRKWTLSC